MATWIEGGPLLCPTLQAESAMEAGKQKGTKKKYDESTDSTKRETKTNGACNLSANKEPLDFSQGHSEQICAAGLSYLLSYL